jgi:c-di-GMP-binding flagellar brake protein YcgR
MHGFVGGQAFSVFAERRRNKRYSLRCSLSYLALSKSGPRITGSGETLDISSSGVLFRSDQVLAARLRVKLYIHWPVELDGVKALDLIIHGTVVRRAGNLIAIKREKHDFFIRPNVLEIRASNG